MFNVGTYCALVILIELGERYMNGGCTLKDISVKHQVPMSELDSVVNRLDGAGFVRVEKEWLFLRIPPSGVYIYNVIELFCCEFPGSFVDSSSGVRFPQSKALKLINKESEYLKKVVKTKFRMVDLEKYCKMMRNYSF